MSQFHSPTKLCTLGSGGNRNCPSSANFATIQRFSGKDKNQ